MLPFGLSLPAHGHFSVLHCQSWVLAFFSFAFFALINGSRPRLSLSAQFSISWPLSVSLLPFYNVTLLQGSGIRLNTLKPIVGTETCRPSTLSVSAVRTQNSTLTKTSAIPMLKHSTQVSLRSQTLPSLSILASLSGACRCLDGRESAQ